MRPIAVIALFVLTGCGGGGGGGSAPAPAPAPPPVFQDGLGTTGVSANATKVFDSGREEYSIFPELALAGSGDVVLAWSRLDTGVMWVRGQGASWSAPAQIAPATIYPLSVSGNNAGHIAARWAIGRLFQFTPLTGWRPAVTDQETDTFGSSVAPVYTLGDGSAAYMKRAAPTPPTGNLETQLLLVSLSGRLEKYAFPDYFKSTVVASKSVWGLLHGDRAATGPWAVSWRAFNPDLTTASVVTLAEASNYCEMGPAGYSQGPLFGVMSDARYGVAAAALSRDGYQDAGLNYANCDLVAAPLQQTSAASAQTLTLPTGHLADVPVVAAGGNLSLVLWREATSGGASGRTGWFASSSVSGGPLSSPARFGPPTPNISSPALVIDSSGRATVAVIGSLTALPSLQRIYVANYSASAGWSEWRQVFAGYSAGAPSLAVNDAGDVALAFGATPCDRTPAFPEPVCSTRKTGALFVIRNP